MSAEQKKLILKYINKTITSSIIDNVVVHGNAELIKVNVLAPYNIITYICPRKYESKV